MPKKIETFAIFPILNAQPFRQINKLLIELLQYTRVQHVVSYCNALRSKLQWCMRWQMNRGNFIKAAHHVKVKALYSDCEEIF